MSPRDLLVRSATVVFLWSSCFGLAQSDRFSLKHGTYVQQGTDCKDPPFAAMLRWDGTGFSGAHSSRCVTRVASHHGNQWKLTTTCSALGDGSPDPSGVPDTTSLDLTRLSNTGFTLDAGTQVASRYRWCSAR